MKPYEETVSLVLMGQLNPAIFQPAWLAANNLVRQEEADNANIEVIHSELTRVSMDWLVLQVQRNRFEASTSQTAYYEPLRDLVIGIFSLLSHTPLVALGINRIFEVELSQKQSEQLGEKLVRSDTWNNILASPTIHTLSMVQSKSNEMYPGVVRVIVQNSPNLQQMGTTGIKFNINDHYDLAKDDIQKSHQMLQEILASKWEQSIETSLHIASNIWSLGEI